jgi:hypothetical protein
MPRRQSKPVAKWRWQHMDRKSVGSGQWLVISCQWSENRGPLPTDHCPLITDY